MSFGSGFEELRIEGSLSVIGEPVASFTFNPRPDTVTANSRAVLVCPSLTLTRTVAVLVAPLANVKVRIPSVFGLM